MLLLLLPHVLDGGVHRGVLQYGQLASIDTVSSVFSSMVNSEQQTHSNLVKKASHKPDDPVEHGPGLSLLLAGEHVHGPVGLLGQADRVR